MRIFHAARIILIYPFFWLCAKLTYDWRQVFWDTRGWGEPDVPFWGKIYWKKEPYIIIPFGFRCSHAQLKYDTGWKAVLCYALLNISTIIMPLLVIYVLIKSVF